MALVRKTLLSQSGFAMPSLFVITAVLILGGVAVVNNYFKPGELAQFFANENSLASQEVKLKIRPNDKAKGLVFDDLEEDITGECKGLLKLKNSDNGPKHAKCTHGPDPIPEGIEALADSVTTAQTGVTGQVCDGDGISGKRIQVIYARSSDKADRYTQYQTSFQQWALDANMIFVNSAAETGGVRNLRFVHDSNCTPQVTNVTLSNTGDDSLANTRTELFNQGFNRSDRKYMVFVDAAIYCGIANINIDDQPGQTNANNLGPTIARIDTGCWGGRTAAHEIMHTLGGVQNSAPNKSGGYHCVDEYDLMCYSDTPSYPAMQYKCPSSHANLFDCNHEDYYHTSPAAGSYLDTHWNTVNNAFLITSGSLPSSIPTTSPTPTPITSTNPSPTPTPTPTPNPTASNNPIDSTPPVVTITSPANNATVSRNTYVNYSASSTDNVKVAKVEFYLENTFKCTRASLPYSCSFKIGGKPNTTYAVTAKSYDTSGNVATATIQIKVQ